MSYEDVVGKKCLFCESRITGNQQFMLGAGHTLPGRRGRAPKWLRDKPEYEWQWNGLDKVEFYLCPNHQTDADWEKAWKFAQNPLNALLVY